MASRRVLRGRQLGNVVIPTKVWTRRWVPAFAGMTAGSGREVSIKIFSTDPKDPHGLPRIFGKTPTRV